MTHTTPLFPTGQKEPVSSRLIPQGQALRVASQALPDQPRLHKEYSSGWKNVATSQHLANIG